MPELFFWGQLISSWWQVNLLVDEKDGYVEVQQPQPIIK